nr:MAG TPA: hypothetical protein [Caudoviricetes sp.]
MHPHHQRVPLQHPLQAAGVDGGGWEGHQPGRL